MRAKRFFALLFPFAASLSFADSVIIGGSWKGLNDADSSVMIEDGEAQDLLNVDITDNGYGIKERDGTNQFKTIGTSTWGVRGGYKFKTSAGTDLIIHANNRSVFKSDAGGNYTAFITTDTDGSYYDFTDSNGFLWRATSNRDEIAKYDGTTLTYYPSHPKGNQIEALPTMLVISGTAANPNRVNFSATADFTDFTVGILETSAFYEEFGLPGQAITAIKYAFGRLLVWTNTTLSYWEGTNQFDGVIEDISSTVGTGQPDSIICDQGLVTFQGNDGHFYAYDGDTLTKISDKISGSVKDFVGGESKLWVQTTETDFEAGTYPDLSTTLTPGSIMLSTWTATDTTAADFGAGTLIGISSTITPGSLYCSSSTNISNNSFEYNASNIPYDFALLEDVSKYKTTSLYSKDGSSSFSILEYLSGGSDLSLVVRLVDTSNSPLVVSTYAFTSFSGSGFTQQTMSLVGYSGQQVRLEIAISKTPFTTSTSILRSNDFICNGGNLTFWARLHPSISSICFIDLFEGGRQAGGTFLSQSFDTGISSCAWLASDVNGTLNGNVLKAETQTSPDGSSWDSLVAWSTGAAPASDWDRYIRYKLTISTSASTTGVATITDATLAARSSTGTFTSQAKEIGTGITSWGNFNADSSGDGTIAYFVRTASSSAMLTSASWVSATNNAQITASTNSFVQVKATFTITAATQTPSLDSFILNWNEGSVTHTFGVPDKNHRLFWSVAEDASAYNNATYIYDPRFSTWLKYSIPFDAPARVGDKIYFGGASKGYVYTYPSGSSDSGSDFTAFWKSKDFIGGDPFIEKNWTKYSIIAKAEAGSSITFQISTNTLAGVSVAESLTESSGSTIRRINDFIPHGTVSSFLNFKFGNTTADTPFEVYSLKLDYEPRAWRVLQ